MIFSDNVLADSEGSQTRIVFGGNTGLPSTFSAGNSTRIEFPGGKSFPIHYERSVGDINGDGATDLYFDSYDNPDIVVLGQAGDTVESIDTEKFDGENGFLLLTPSYFNYSNVTLSDVTGDGIDDVLGYGSTLLLAGRPITNQPKGVQGLSVATGHSTTFLSWTAPEAGSNVEKIEIFVNEALIDSIDANTSYYQFDQPAPDSTAVLRVRYINALSQSSPASDVPLSNPFQALQQLRAKVYAENSVELFWGNEPNDYVVWRNGVVLAQVSGNSYFDSEVQAGVEYRYHVTQGRNASGLKLGRSITLPPHDFFFGCIDYCGDYDGYDPYYYYGECYPTGTVDDRSPVLRSLYPASTDELLVVTDVRGAEFSTPAISVVDPCDRSGEFRTASNGYQVYSKTALELFWVTASHPSGVTAYEISLLGEVLTTIDASSYYVDNVGDEVLYEYKVTAIAGDGSRSIPAVYSIYILENDQNYIDESNQPPPSAAVRAEVYSSTAAELFWNRVYDYVGSTVTYRVSRNGEALLTTDAQSYFDSALQPDTTYYYEVVTINQAGITGVASTIQVNTPSESGGEASANVLPIGARGQVYSNSALELFWDRSADGAVSRYIIYRNDELIGDTDGITFYDAGLEADAEYRYLIEATRSDGVALNNAALVILKTKR